MRIVQQLSDRIHSSVHYFCYNAFDYVGSQVTIKRRVLEEFLFNQNMLFS